MNQPGAIVFSGRVVAVTSGDHPHHEHGFAAARHAPRIIVSDGTTSVVVPSPDGTVLPVGVGVDVTITVTDPNLARSITT